MVYRWVEPLEYIYKESCDIDIYGNIHVTVIVVDRLQ